jgi:photosystem II stability/assembly factor-like uncharacterized protein
MTSKMGLRRRLIVGALALPLVFAACGGGKPKATPLPTTPTTTHSARSPTTSTPTSVTNSSTTAPSTTVPQGFEAASVTFVSPKMGWVLGTTCTGTSCAASLFRTDDAGKSWASSPTPPIMGDMAGDGGEVRFANADDGWVVVAGSGSAFSPQVWATFDGGSSWHAVSFPAPVVNETISDLEAAHGEVYASFCGDPVHIAMSPVNVSAWTVSTTSLQIGAGPVCGEQIVLQATNGWLINIDRTVINGARLHDGSWVPWNPPCQSSGGPGELAASDPDHLVAICDSGVYAGPAAVQSSFSSDGGSTFVPATHSLPQADYGPCASPSPGVIIIGSSAQGDLMGSFDGGEQWSPVYSSPTSQGWEYVGFTTTSQGVAIESNGTLVMTVDGGHDWAPVKFPTTSSQ